MLLNLLIKAELPAWGKKLSSYMTNWIWSKLWHLIEIVLRRWTSYYTCILEFLQENSKHFLLHTGGVHFRCLPSEAFSLLPVNFNETFYKISHTEETKNFVHWQCIPLGYEAKHFRTILSLRNSASWCTVSWYFYWEVTQLLFSYMLLPTSSWF